MKPETILAEPSQGRVGKVTEDGVFFANDEIVGLFPGKAARARAELRSRVHEELTSLVPIAGTPKKPPRVRVATMDDESPLFDLLMLDLSLGHAEHLGRVSEAAVIEHIQAATRPPKTRACGVIDGVDGKPVALTILGYDRGWWTKEWHIVEMTTFVHPDHRKSRHADDLLEWAKWMSHTASEEFGYRIALLAGVMSLFDIRRKMRLYRRHMNQIGAFFFFPFPPGLKKD